MSRQIYWNVTDGKTAILYPSFWDAIAFAKKQSGDAQEIQRINNVYRYGEWTVSPSAMPGPDPKMGPPMAEAAGKVEKSDDPPFDPDPPKLVDANGRPITPREVTPIPPEPGEEGLTEKLIDAGENIFNWLELHVGSRVNVAIDYIAEKTSPFVKKGQDFANWMVEGASRQANEAVSAMQTLKRKADRAVEDRKQITVGYLRGYMEKAIHELTTVIERVVTSNELLHKRMDKTDVRQRILVKFFRGEEISKEEEHALIKAEEHIDLIKEGRAPKVPASVFETVLNSFFLDPPSKTTLLMTMHFEGDRDEIKAIVKRVAAKLAKSDAEKAV